MKRLFIGVSFSNELNKYFKDAQLMINKYCEVARYTRDTNFHLTLKFLGMQEESVVPQLIQVIDSIEVNEVMLWFDHIGFFKKKNRYVIYMGTHPNEHLTKIAMDLHELLVEKNLTAKEEFIYTPHVTLCRNTKLLVPPVDLSRGTHIDKKTLIANITLYESINVNGILRYQPLYIREV